MIQAPHRAGFAPLGEIAEHWRVDPTTARSIFEAAGVRALRRKRRRLYAWVDVWRLEGAGDVLPEDMPSFRQPLLAKREIADRYGLSDRTARRWLAEQTIPAIRLAPRILRARAITLERGDDALLAAPEERTRATD